MKKLQWLIVVPFLLVACDSQETLSQPTIETPAYSPQPYASLAQVMRAILFPNSEIIFAAQSEDPEAPADPADAGALGSYGDLYGGWEGVENAALILAEAANLIMIPGRLCENGLPVPLQNEDFRMFAQGLVEAGQAAYKAAQTRDLDAMIEVSGPVSDACFSCHEIYRDKPEGEMRCIPGEPQF